MPASITAIMPRMPQRCASQGSTSGAATAMHSVKRAGARKLTIEVRYTERGPVEASVNLVDAVLVK